MNLSPEERQRIYAEELARAHARQHAEATVRSQMAAMATPKKKEFGCLSGCLVTLGVCFALGLVGQLIIVMSSATMPPSSDEATTEPAPRSNRKRAKPAPTIDPSECPTGEVRFNADDPDEPPVVCTGKAKRSPGAAAKTADPEGDDDDVAASCKSVRDAIRALNGNDLIASCTAPLVGHPGLKVVVTNAGWERLADEEGQKDFAKSLVDVMKPHWKKFHGWRGANPKEHLVAIYVPESGGLDLKIVASANAAGEFSFAP